MQLKVGSFNLIKRLEEATRIYDICKRIIKEEVINSIKHLFRNKKD